MELAEYIRVLRRRGWIIILVLVLTAAAAFAFSKLQTPIYESSVDILIAPARADWSLTQSAKILLRSYTSWMDTDNRAREVIDLLQLDRLPAELRSNVKIASDDSRLVIQLTVEDPDGDLGNDIAQAWTNLFIQWRNEENAQQNKEDQVKAIQLDPPRYGLARPKWQINVVAGAVLGALIGIVIVFVLEWVESGVVRRPEDVDRYLGLPLLGTIPVTKIDISRPYRPGGWEGASGVRRDANSPTRVREVEATFRPPPRVPEARAEIRRPPAAAPTAVEEETTPAMRPPEEPAPPAPAAPEEIGPIQPTILHSKGDE